MKMLIHFKTAINEDYIFFMIFLRRFVGVSKILWCITELLRSGCVDTATNFNHRISAALYFSYMVAWSQ